jgi:DNA-directed RNA polymerase specialized sigma24 family protein
MGEQQSRFEKLLLPHLDSAYNVAYWVLQSDRDAQAIAIVQEGFAQAWREFEKSRELDTRVWLLSIIDSFDLGALAKARNENSVCASGAIAGRP